MADYIVISRGETAPPVAPEEGDQYIVAVDGSGAWVGWDNSVAHFANAAWELIVPSAEAVAVIEDEELTVVYKGSPDYWVEWEPWRERLTAPRTYYVRAAGSDVTGDGLSVGTAVNSISKAEEIAAALDTNNYDVTIDAIEARTHASTITTKALFGGGRGFIVGGGSSVTAIGSMDATEGDWELSAVTVNGGINSTNVGAVVRIGDDVRFDGTVASHLFAAGDSTIRLVGDYTIAAITSAGEHMLVQDRGKILKESGCDVTVESGALFDDFAIAKDAGFIDYVAGSVTGSVLGKRFEIEAGAKIRWIGDASNFPGSTNGTVEDGGQFIGANYVLNPYRNNYAATTDPTVNDDADDYYAVGSRWTNVTDDIVWDLVDATVGAAIWQRRVVYGAGVDPAGSASVSPRCVHIGGAASGAPTTGTDTTPVNTEAYIGEVMVLANMSITGIAIHNGSAVAGNMKVGLYNSSGNLLATSASTAQAGVNSYQRIPFTVSYDAKGPATYYAAVMFDTNTTPRFRAQAIGSFGAAKQTGQVFATGFTTITPPTTFTADLAPRGSLY